jgi:hypothetical protein
MRRKEMKLKRFGFVIAALLVMLLVAGCGSTPAPGTETTTAREAEKADVPWDDESSGYLTVQNDVPEDLILFAGSINNRNLLGGVRQLEERRVDFFDDVDSSSGTFLLRAVKESVYRAKGSALGSEDIVFAGLVTFDKDNPRQINVNIQKVVGGDARIIMENDTNMALQIRIDNPNGPVLTTLAPFERSKIVYMDPNTMGYTFFPVYQYYDRASMGIRSVMATSLADGQSMMPEVPNASRPIPRIIWDGKPEGLFSPFATLLVNNETTGGIFLTTGVNPMTNQNGTQMINPGIETYELNLQKMDRFTISNLKVDPRQGAANIMDIPSFEYQAGYTYMVNVNRGVQPQIIEVGKDDSSSLSIDLLNE